MTSSKDVANVNSHLLAARQQMASIQHTIAKISTVEEWDRAWAALAGSKAWAKTQNLLTDIRVDVLRYEAELLTLAYTLGRTEKLNSRDQESAKFLAAMTAAQRDAFVREWSQRSSATTIHTLIQRSQREDEIQLARDRGWQDAYTSSPAPVRSETIRDAYTNENAVREAIGNYLNKSIEDGEEFNPADLVLDVASQVGIDLSDPLEWAHRDAYMQATRELIRRSKTPKIGSTQIPKALTVITEEGTYRRLSYLSARLSHLDQMIEIRREGIKADQKSLDELVEARILLADAGVTDEDPKITDCIQLLLAKQHVA